MVASYLCVLRFIKVEEARHKREIEYQLKQTEIENQRREQERRHELEMFKLLLEHKPMQNQYGSIQTTLPLSMAGIPTPSIYSHINQWDQSNNITNLYTQMASSSSTGNIVPNENAEYISL